MAVEISDQLLDGSARFLEAEPDEHLVSLVHTGREGAFAAIVRRYEHELQAHARRLTSDGRGEDAVQQAFLNAFAALQGGAEVRHLRGWLHQILRHEVTRARVPVDAPLEAATAYGETLEDTVQRRATVRTTLAQLSALPDRQRDALLGTAVFGLPRAHVARTMGLSEGAVRQLVHRARLRLRQAATAFIPWPLVKVFGAARSGVDAAPDAALGAGSAVSGGVVIKVGALVASGVVATGIAVTQTLPSRHHAAVPAPGARHHVAHTAAPGRGSTASPATVAPSDPASVVSGLRLRDHGAAAAREDRDSNGGPGRLSGTRSGRPGGLGSGQSRRGGPSRGGGRGHEESSSGGPAENGSGSSQSGVSGRGHGDGGGSGSGSGSGDDGRGSGSGSGSGHQGGSGSRAGSATGSGASGSDDGVRSSGGGHGSGRSGGDGGGVTSAEGDASTASASDSSDSATSATDTEDETSGDGGGSTSGGSGTSGDADTISSDGQTVSPQSSDSPSGSGGGKEHSGGSRDVSGSLDSSSS
ncbi:MAG: RNA polymerase sigma factor [Solirubrobacteraceae bacterium]